MQIGNLHPLLVHLPIGIIIMVFLMELLRFRKPPTVSQDALLFVLGTGALFSVLSLISGWLLGNTGGYDLELLNDHKWMAVAFTVTCMALFLVKLSKKQWAKKIYFPLLLVTLALLFITGHYGGNITHGEDFLFKDRSEAVIEIEDVDNAKVYAQIVQPIFKAKCVSCHNTNKVKGGLMLTSKEEILAGGDTGGLFDTLSDANNTLLVHRITLPLENEEHMPPKGKLQLTDEEKLLLQWWIDNDNCFDCIVENLEADDKTSAALASLEVDRSPRALIAKELDLPSPEDLAALRLQNIDVRPLAAESPLLIANLSRRKDLSEREFELLRKVDEHIVELNLAHSNFNDTLAPFLKKFKNLTKLQLRQTMITVEGLAHIKKLEHLESLNLFATSISAEALQEISEIQSLKDLYLDPTLSSSDLALLDTDRITLHGKDIDSLFASSELVPPVIMANGEIFNDSLLITINNVFDDSKTRYRVAGGQHDSIEFEYQDPFYLKESATLIAYTTKEGWKPSEPSKAIFLKSGAKIANASYASLPHQKYIAAGAKTLIDKKRGSTNFVDGNWLGYEKSHLLATVELEKATEVSSVAIGHLSAADNWIFSPVGYKVWGSSDGKNFRHLKTIELPPNPPSTDIQLNLFNIDFPKTTLKSVRVQVRNQLKNPDWHQNPGGDSFIFIDEIVLN